MANTHIPYWPTQTSMKYEFFYHMAKTTVYKANEIFSWPQWVF